MRRGYNPRITPTPVQDFRVSTPEIPWPWSGSFPTRLIAREKANSEVNKNPKRMPITNPA
jgi:hypothetical protein